MVQHQRETKLFGKKFSDNSTKAQSAMEYLMTYGWAILIIAVILAALDFLGVFNGNTFIGTSCLATPGYLCSSPVFAISNSLQPDNLLSFTFKQDTGQTLYNVQFACAASANSLTGMPNARNVANSGFKSFTGINAIASGSSVDVQGLQCYDANGNPLSNLPIGSAFGGSIWINYTTLGSSTPQYAVVAKLTAKVELTSVVSLATNTIPPPLNTVTNTITVGSDPWGVAFSPNGAYAYVTNYYSGTVSVINTATNTVTNTITVGSSPVGVAIAPTGAYAYVTNYNSGTVSVINTATNTVTSTITVGSEPIGVAIAPTGAYAYVTNYGSNTVSVINTATNTVTSTITVGGNLYEVAVAPNGAYAYVTNFGNGIVSVLST